MVGLNGTISFRYRKTTKKKKGKGTMVRALHPSRPSQTVRTQKYFEQLQESICGKLEELDATARFREDIWRHKDGGGGRSRILEGGHLFEKAGVNTSAITSAFSEATAERIRVKPQRFSATGISLVLHPVSPMIPAVHANFRYFEMKNGDAWFGGGSDLTPSYLFEEDVKHFHGVWKHACDRHNRSYYPKFKRWCDEYFYLKHRNETRGVGGIFFDDLRSDFETSYAFVQECGNSFLEAYIPIVDRRRNTPWGEEEKHWQLVRRGRYVEFNLLYDRGTVFGLETQGRVESILMSLPPLVRWEYDVNVKPESRESEMMKVLREPREWVGGE